MKKVQGGTIMTGKEFYEKHGSPRLTYQKNWNKRTKEMHDYKVSLTKALNKKK